MDEVTSSALEEMPRTQLAHVARLSAGVLPLLLAAGVSAAVAQPYRVVVLPPLPGQPFAVVDDINNQLQIVGRSGDQACIWDAAGGVRPLGITSTTGLRINNQGVIAGTRLVAGRQEPFLWSGGVVSRPPVPPGDLNRIHRLTDNGIILMSASSGSWAAVGDTLYNLAELTGPGIDINDVNDAGTIGGAIGPFGPGGSYLRYLDGRILSAPSSVVEVIGSAGHFAGTFLVTSFLSDFFRGTPDGTVTAIGGPSPSRFPPRVNDINRRGDFVGHTGQFSVGLGFAGVLYRNNKLWNLTDTIVDPATQVVDAYAINDVGYVLALARLGGAAASSVLLVPVAPQAPTGVMFSVTGRTVTLVWTASVGALDYVLEAGGVPGASNLFNAPIGSESRLTTVAPPGRYYVRLRARNDVGTGGPSTEIVIDVP